MPLLPCQTNSKPAAPLYAPAGAGGGGGGGGVSTFAQLYTSSIGTPNPVANDLVIIGVSSINNIVFDLTQPTLGQILIQPSTTTGSQIAGCIVNATDLGNNDYQMFIGGSQGTSSCVVTISTLNCSTINGAAPGGGGGGPNPSVSTLSVNDTGNITLDWNNGGGTLNFGFEATNTSSFQLQQGIGVSGTKVAGPEGCLQVLEKDGGANQVFAPLQASGFEVCATAYPGGAFAGLYFSSIGSILYSAVGQPLTIDAPAGVSMSSLTVSSINGAAPGGGGNPYPFPSTLKKGDAVGLALNASSLTTLAAFSTISSHFYTVSVDITPRQLTQTFGPVDAYQSQLTTDDGLVNILNNGLWGEVSTLYNSALSITPGLGGSATFKAGGNFMTVDVYNTYNNFLSTNLNAVFAVDHGPGP